MSQHTRFQKNKLAIAISMILANIGVVGLTGCDSGGDTTSGDNNVVYHETHQPTGTVMGAVKDSNGNPIPNADIYVGTLKTKTNEGGSFAFERVPVMNMAGTNAAADDANAGALIVTVVPPAPKAATDPTYIGASAIVRPEAQIDDSDGGKVTTPSTGVTVFVDGFSVSTGTIVLPEIGASVTGYLRDKNSDAPIANVPVSLDLKSVGGDSTIANEGVEVKWTSLKWGATTEPNGHFVIEHLPKDSIFDFVVGGGEWGFDAKKTDGTPGENGIADQTFRADAVNTLAETELSVIDISNIRVVKFDTNDKIGPYIVTVDKKVATDANGRAILAKGVGASEPIILNFSEVLAEEGARTSSGMIRVVTIAKNGSVQDLENISATVSGSKLTINATIPESTDFDVLLNVANFTDPSSNVLDDGPDAQKDADGKEVVVDKFLYDSFVASAQYIKVILSTYKEPKASADSIKDLVQMSIDNSKAPNNLELLCDDPTTLDTETCAVFSDVDDTSLTGLNNLNSAEDSDGDMQVDADERIAALAEKINTVAFGNNPGRFSNNDVPIGKSAARIKFTHGGAVSYNLQIRDRAGNKLILDPANAGQQVNISGTPGIVRTGTNPPTQGIGYPDAYTANFAIDVESADLLFPYDGTVEMVLRNVNGNNALAPDSIVYIYPVDGFEYVNAPKTITLKDNIPPTAVLQRSYDAKHNATVAGEIEAKFGEGGELSGGTDKINAIPLLAITPRLLNNDNSNSSNPNAYLEFPATLQEEIGTFNGEGKFKPATDVYDATAWDAFIKKEKSRERVVGIAFSENVKKTADPKLSDPKNPDATTPFVAGLSNWVENLDVVVNANIVVENDRPRLFDGADLIDVTVDDVMTLANVDDGKIIDFSGLIKDTSDNVAQNAKVQIADKMPPFVTKSSYQGEKVVIEFNEPISLKPGMRINLSNTNGLSNIALMPANKVSADYVLDGTETLDATKTILTLPTRGWMPIDGGNLGARTVNNEVGILSRRTLFAVADNQSGMALQYPETIYDTVIQAHTNNDHAVLNYEDIADAKGNTWKIAVAQLNVNKPYFAAIDAVGPMKILDATFTVNADNTAKVVFTFNHPLFTIPPITNIFEIKKPKNDDNLNPIFVPFTAIATQSDDKMTLTIALTPATELKIEVGDMFDLVEDAPATPLPFPFDDALANEQLEFVFRSAYAPADDGIVASQYNPDNDPSTQDWPLVAK